MKPENEFSCTSKLDSAIDSLIFVLSSRDGLMRKTVRRSLVEIGEAALPHLVNALGDKNKNVRWEATKALGEMNNPAAAPALVQALRDEDFGVRWLAAEALTSLGRDGVRPLLQGLILDPDSKWLRDGAHHVFRALATTRLRHALGPVMEVLDGLPHEDGIVARAHTALEVLDKAGRRPHTESKTEL